MNQYAIHCVICFVCLGTPLIAVAEERALLSLQDVGFSTVSDLCFSPDDSQLAAGGAGEARIWNLSDGSILRTLRGYRDPGIGIGTVWSIAFSPDHQSILTGIADYGQGERIRIYDMKQLDRIAGMFPGEYHSPLKMAFSSDGKWLATLQDQLNSDEDSVVIYDWSQKKEVARFPIEAIVGIHYFGFAGSDHVLTLLRFDSGINRMFLGPDWKSIELNDEPERRIEKRLNRANASEADQSAARKCLALLKGMLQVEWLELPDAVETYRYAMADIAENTDLFVISGEHTDETGPVYWVGACETNGHVPQAFYKGHRYRIHALSLSHDGTRCASCDLLGEVHIWSTKTGELLHRFQSFGKPIFNAGLDAGRKELAFGTRSYGPSEWRANHYAPLDQSLVFANRQIESPQQSFSEGVTELDGFSLKRIVTEEVLQRVELSTPNGEVLYWVDDDTPYCWGLLPQTQGRGVRGFVLGQGGSGLIWVGTRSSATGRARPRRWFLGHHSSVFSAVPTEDGKLLVTSGSDGLVNIFSLEDLQPWGNLDFEVDDWKSGLITDVGAAAKRDGIQPGDVLVKLDGVEVIPFMTRRNSDIERAAELKIGTVMELQIERDGETFTRKHTLVEGPDAVEPLLTFFVSRQGEWVLWSPQGYYDCSPGGHALIGWRLNQGKNEESKFYPVDRFRKTLYRPDIIDAILREGSVKAALKLTATEGTTTNAPLVDFRRAEVLERNEPPEVHIVNPADGFQSEQMELKLTIEAKSLNDVPIREVTVLKNGRPTESPGELLSPKGDRKNMRLEIPVTLSEGENVFTAIASNVHANSKPSVVKVNYKATTPVGKRPKLFVMAVGISRYANEQLDLQYPHADAQSFIELWQSQNQFYESVETRLLTNEQATSQKVREAMDWLLESVTQHDVAMIFLASHGVYDARKNYYLATHDAHPDRLRSTAVPYTDVTRLIGDMPCKVLVFVDTCHSGGITGARTVTDDPWQDIVSEEVGAILFASCHPREVSLESERWQHGAFTYALLAAMQDPRSDVDKDGYVSVSELDLQITQRVKKLTSGQQHPVTQKPATIRNFNLGQLSPVK